MGAQRETHAVAVLEVLGRSGDHARDAQGDHHADGHHHVLEGGDVEGLVHLGHRGTVAATSVLRFAPGEGPRLFTSTLMGPRKEIAGKLQARLVSIADGVSLTHDRVPDPEPWADIVAELERIF